ncbi:MAG TPA: ThuA domain-containing protein [Verrucomicrobiota bacterium]|nr:ThuA domain-containing protein [Verrucomicrobiota bacterium]HNU51865.1 ThuA domain-containing protein [Verrucomicrobiota bacterium]
MSANAAHTMLKHLLLLTTALLGCHALAADDVLIVADEFPAMEQLAAALKAEDAIPSRVVAQTNLPSHLTGFSAVIVYIHGNLQARTEQALIEYTRDGGKLVLLHHSISSGKRKNAQWFRFLGITLPEGDVDQGGYKWIEPATLDLVALEPSHFITTHNVPYPKQIDWRDEQTGDPVRRLPGFTLHESEVYLNHVFTEPRTLLLGLKYADPKSGRVWMQPHAGWVKAAARGWIVYLLPGHSTKDFEHPAYRRIVLNAVIWKP